MIDINKLVKSFEEIVGWKYESPGNNTKEGGIDCSGAFVRAYNKQNKKIYHGSNRIIRVHTNGVFKIDMESQLEVGMPVFKSRDNLSGLHKDYHPGGRFYNPDLYKDFYHIGLVCSVNPLRIIHATTPVAKVDTKLGNWGWSGYLSDADYTFDSLDAPINPLVPDIPFNATVKFIGYAHNFPPNQTLNLRKKPNGMVLYKLKYNEPVEVIEESGEWYRVKVPKAIGYVMKKFIKRDLVESFDELPLEEKIRIIEERISELERRIMY